MRYVSLFSGIEAATVAWEPLGWKADAFSEIEPFPCALLEERYPDVPNLGDVTKIDWSDYLERNRRPDVLVGGSPCQSFSIAGGRESLDGESRLMFEYIRAAAELRPRWVVWENVPGCLSAKGLEGERGGAFQCLLRELAQLGYGLCWRVLDAQFFGVAQRRRRVFLVGRLGDPGRAFQVLFEPDCVRGDNPPSREKRAQLAARAGGGPEGAGGRACTLLVRCGCSGGGKGALVSDDVSLTLSTSNNQTLFPDGGKVAKVVSGFSYKASSGVGSIGCEREQSPTLLSGRHDAAICMADDNANAAIDRDMSGSLKIGGSAPIVSSPTATVRRLTPTECERLQGFPDGYTDIELRGKTASDGARYKALGNSMAVPVMRWIGERMAMQEGDL